MSNSSSSDELYLPRDTADTETSDCELSNSDDENYEEEISESKEGGGWKFLVAIFSDVCPKPIPHFDDENAEMNFDLGHPSFTSPGDAFAYFF